MSKLLEGILRYLAWDNSPELRRVRMERIRRYRKRGRPRDPR